MNERRWISQKRILEGRHLREAGKQSALQTRTVLLIADRAASETDVP